MSGRNPPSYCTLTLVAMQGHQQKERQNDTSSNNKDKYNTIIETRTAEDHDDDNLHNPETGVAMPVRSQNTKTTRPRKIQYSGEHNKRQWCPDHRQTFAANSCACVFSSHLFWTSNSLEVPAGVTQDFSSTFLLRCVPLFFSREGFSRSFPLSTVKSD